jgi:hypothetical protein
LQFLANEFVTAAAPSHPELSAQLAKKIERGRHLDGFSVTGNANRRVIREDDEYRTSRERAQT